MGGLPGWWVGQTDGWRWGPTITLKEWDSLLRGISFAGVNTHTLMPSKVQTPESVFVAQAVDDCLLLPAGKTRLYSARLCRFSYHQCFLLDDIPSENPRRTVLCSGRDRRQDRREEALSVHYKQNMDRDTGTRV